MEIWKDIPGYENYYQISNYGVLKSLDRKVKNSRGSWTRKGIFNKPSKDSCGYLQITLNKKGKQRLFKIHQLVAISFLSHSPDKFKYNIDHIDGNIYNNHVSNLQILTYREHRNKTLNKKFPGSQFDKIKKKKKWYSQIRTPEGRKFLGYFHTQEEASNMYKQEIKNLEQKYPT